MSKTLKIPFLLAALLQFLPAMLACANAANIVAAESAVLEQSRPRIASPVLPRDVQRIINQAELCEYLAGEINGDRSAQDREVMTQVKRNKCEDISKKIKALKLKYKDNAVIMKSLAKDE